MILMRFETYEDMFLKFFPNIVQLSLKQARN